MHAHGPCLNQKPNPRVNKSFFYYFRKNFHKMATGNITIENVITRGVTFTLHNSEDTTRVCIGTVENSVLEMVCPYSGILRRCYF